MLLPFDVPPIPTETPSPTAAPVPEGPGFDAPTIALLALLIVLLVALAYTLVTVIKKNRNDGHHNPRYP